MKKINFLFIAITLTISTATHAQNYDCEFSAGSYGKWDAGPVTTAEIIWSEGTVRLIQEPDDSDKFMMVSGIGKTPMSRKDTGFGFTFSSEKLGDPMFLSVFDTSIPNSKGFLAVLSRHAIVLVLPQPSQYHGVCTAVN